jgi:hypothetical protein
MSNPWGQRIGRHEIPTFSYGFPAAVNPHGADAERHSLSWARDFTVAPATSAEFERLKSAKSAWFAAFAMPRANEADLQLAADWAMWLFVHDDIVESSTTAKAQHALMARHARLAAILAGDAVSGTDAPTVRAFADIVARLRVRAPHLWFARFAQAVLDQFRSHEWESSNYVGRRIPSLARYLEMRPRVYWPCVILAMIANDVKSDAAFLGDARIRALTRMALNEISWENDILGINHELEEHNPHNLVLVLAHERRLSLHAALQRAADMTKAERQAFSAGLRECPDFDDEAHDLTVYIETLKEWIHGHLDWYRETARYPFDAE